MVLTDGGDESRDFEFPDVGNAREEEVEEEVAGGGRGGGSVEDGELDRCGEEGGEEGLSVVSDLAAEVESYERHLFEVRALAREAKKRTCSLPPRSLTLVASIHSPANSLVAHNLVPALHREPPSKMTRLFVRRFLLNRVDTVEPLCLLDEEGLHAAPEPVDVLKARVGDGNVANEEEAVGVRVERAEEGRHARIPGAVDVAVEMSDREVVPKVRDEGGREEVRVVEGEVGGDLRENLGREVERLASMGQEMGLTARALEGD